MDINSVFDALFKSFPKAREGKTLGKRPKAALNWRMRDKSEYMAAGARGGQMRVKYNAVSNKITIGYT